MSALNNNEIKKLEVMYEGDKSRDASSKIRGFLFQDYVTIKCLLREEVECVCSEYLEDIDVLNIDGSFEFIQVKHYPRTSPDMKEISTDLYYQYLRLQMLSSSLIAKPSLYIHSYTSINKPSKDEIKEYLDLSNKLCESIEYPKNSEDWLRQNIYTQSTKNEQKKALFEKMSSEDSINKFYDQYLVKNEFDISKYKEELLKTLIKTYPNSNQLTNEDNWKSILMGLAISYIQRRYTLGNPSFDTIKIEKKEFNQYMKDSVKLLPNQSIANYLISIICEKYEEIEKNDDLSDLQRNMLHLIYSNTIQWFENLTKTKDGQYQLLNTISTDEIDIISDFKTQSVDYRLKKFFECKRDFINFLSYLWKILLDICQDKVKSISEINSNKQLFEISTYIDSNITEYICLNFPEDKIINRAIILPRAGGNFTGVKRKIISRILKITKKPEKWFFADSELMKTKNFYSYSTANINENPSVVDLGKDTFYIECMKCIKIGEGDWNKKEICDDCIFLLNCVNEGKE